MYADHFRALLDNPTNADVEFSLKDAECIHAHKIVLCAASPLFRRIFGVDKDNANYGALTSTSSSSSSTSPFGKDPFAQKKSTTTSTKKKKTSKKKVEVTADADEGDEDVPEIFLCPISQEVMVSE